ncbi:MAG: 5-oxoprolinase subunit PxpA [Akkermansiaceae bacterium]|jgi:UPF0271 protein
MKLNADVGEGVGDDEALCRWIGMANVACGYHAGDLQVMTRTVDLAVTYGVVVGAHPGYRDREAFGRRSIAHLPGEIESLVVDQVEALSLVCQELGTRVEYIKPHGALYHDMMDRIDVFEEILQAACNFSDSVPVMIMARGDNEKHQLMGKKYGVSLLFEAFADRAYTDDGGLMDRAFDGALYSSPDQMVEQAIQIATQGTVTSAEGKTLALNADTICVHGDNPASIAAAKQIYIALKAQREE